MGGYSHDDLMSAMAFARKMVSLIEFSPNTVSDNLNPFNIMPVARDYTVESYIREIFSKIEYKEITWKDAGVSHWPESLALKYGKYAPDFVFSVSACELLDCFNYSSLDGKPCENQLNVKLNAMADRDIVACRPICALFKGRGSQIYYDYEKKACRLGCQSLRLYCLCPKLRSEQEVRGITGMPSFYYDTQNQNCLLTESYCKGFEVMDFKNDDCFLPPGQKILEMFFGKNVTRNMKIKIRDSNAYSSKVLEAQELERRRKVFKNKFKSDHKPFKAIDKLINSQLSANVLSETSTSSKNVKYITAIKKLGCMAGDASILAGVVFGEQFTANLIKDITTKISTAITTRLAERFAGESIEHGVAMIGTLLAEKSFGLIACKTAAAFLETIASAVNPAMWALDVFFVASIVWDLSDNRFGVITSKEELLKTRNTYIEQWNMKHNVSENKHQTHTSVLDFFEIKPYHLYHMLFGDFYDEGSRNSLKHQETILWYTNEYLRSIDADSKKSLKLEPSHAEETRLTFIDGVISRFEFDKLNTTFNAVCALAALFTAISVPCFVSNTFLFISLLFLTVLLVTTITFIFGCYKTNRCVMSKLDSVEEYCWNKMRKILK